ncbi:MAG: DUF1194 domain-containing protein [Hyphomicrobiaceae bacterium]|nr:DUF1194 domain-containing protein [Hyphomicrobiaceae bacterium]
MRHWICAGLAAIGLALSLAPAAASGPFAEGPPAGGSGPAPSVGESPGARSEVDLLLVLAVDISRSVDERKFRLQREGYAAALTNPKVIRAIGSGVAGRIAISLIEWSGVAEQAIIADWTAVGSLAEAEALAQRIRAAPRAFMGRTAVGSAIEFALLQLPRSPWRAARHLIDVSGDGTSNSGIDLEEARRMALAQGVTINGLAILSEVPLPFNPLHTHPPGGLLNYYQTSVIGGPNSFAIAAENHEAFGNAILSKLIKEIALEGAPATRR